MKVCLLEFVGSRADAVPVPKSSTLATCQALREALYPVGASPNHSPSKILVRYGCIAGETATSFEVPPAKNDCGW